MISMASTRRRGASLALLALGLLALAPASARQADRDQPMDVKAAHFDGFQKPNSVSTLKGDVIITQGTLKATGAQAKVYFDADSQISRVVLSGNPAHLQQQDDNGNLMQGEAATIDYQVGKDLALLQGHASVVQQGRGEAHGDRLSYNTRTSQMTGDSGGDGRVHMIFKPRPKAAAASASAPAPAATPPAATSVPAAPGSSGQR
jgi:lipopolysaccharide export system protein LptA